MATFRADDISTEIYVIRKSPGKNIPARVRIAHSKALYENEFGMFEEKKRHGG